MTRHTEDNETVEDNDLVYEVMRVYYNAEACNYPEPEQRKVKLIPKGTMIWKYETNCRNYCMYIRNSKV